MAIIIIIFITDYILRLINRSVYKTSISQLLLLYNKQPKTQIIFIYCQKGQTTAAHFWHFCFKNYWNAKAIIKIAGN